MSATSRYADPPQRKTAQRRAGKGCEAGQGSAPVESRRSRQVSTLSTRISIAWSETIASLWWLKYAALIALKNSWYSSSYRRRAEIE